MPGYIRYRSVSLNVLGVHQTLNEYSLWVGLNVTSTPLARTTTSKSSLNGVTVSLPSNGYPSTTHFIPKQSTAAFKRTLPLALANPSDFWRLFRGRAARPPVHPDRRSTPPSGNQQQHYPGMTGFPVPTESAVAAWLRAMAPPWISGENLLLVCLLMAPPQKLEPPANPERFRP